MTFFTIHKRIAETSEMTGSHPSLRVHKDRAVDTDIVWVLLYKLLPPCFFYIVFQFYTEIAVIPCIRQTAVNL